jgi:hypothetical protein
MRLVECDGARPRPRAFVGAGEQSLVVRRRDTLAAPAGAAKALQSRHLAATDGADVRMITEGCANAGSILDNFALFHPHIELLDFRNPKILQMCRRLFES